MALQLTSGQNAPLQGDRITIAVSGPVDLTALVLGGSGKVGGDADMVFFNQPAAPGVALDDGAVDIRLSALRHGAEQVALVASPAQEGRSFGEIPAVRLTVGHAGETMTYTPDRVSTETALVLFLLYRRTGKWKARALGQGYASGLAGVATDYGIEVELDGAGPTNPPARASAPPPVRSAPDMVKKPLGSINLAKSGAAVIPMATEDYKKLRIRASLRWAGRARGASDLDLYALYVDEEGAEQAVYYKAKGDLRKAPFIKLDKDSRGAGEETLTIVVGHHRYVLLCAYSAVGNGVGSFKDFQAHVVVDDGLGSVVTVPLFHKSKFSYWVAIALIDFTVPGGAVVNQVEAYGKNFSERRPLLHPDGRIEMSKGPVEFKWRRS